LNILITSLSRKVPLLEALRAALRDRADDGVVWGADSDPECVGRYFADRFWEMPPLAEPGSRKRIARFCSENGIGLLVPTRDGELLAFAGLREELAGAGTHVAIGTEDAVAVCLDKLRFHDHCRHHGIPTARTSTRLDDIDGDRLVVKERSGAGSRALGVGLDRGAARAHAQRLDEPIFQPLLEGVEHSVDLYVNRDGHIVDAAPRTRIRIHEGESVVTETVEHPELVEAAIGFAESLALRGHLVVQAFVDGRDVALLECNPRVGGASTLGFHAGIDSPRWAIAEAQGETVEPRFGEYQRGLRMVRYPADRLFAEWS
jgi:carbamoyl-phosphate synthase large subunit